MIYLYDKKQNVGDNLLTDNHLKDISSSFGSLSKKCISRLRNYKLMDSITKQQDDYMFVLGYNYTGNYFNTNLKRKYTEDTQEILETLIRID